MSVQNAQDGWETSNQQKEDTLLKFETESRTSPDQARFDGGSALKIQIGAVWID